MVYFAPYLERLALLIDLLGQFTHCHSQ